MTEAERLAQRLDDEADLCRNDGATDIAHVEQAAAMIRSQQAQIEELRQQVANLKTVMIAAAEEIHAHWDAHCDADGYGPANLMRRLEEGIPAKYGYTAGRFEELRAENEQLRLSITFIVDRDLTYFDGYVDQHQIPKGAIDQARRAAEAKP
jgi:hypothetical protein